MSLRLAAVLLAGVGLLLAAAPGGRAGAGAGPGASALLWPVSRFVLTQGFGCTEVALEPAAPACPGGHFHSGLDLAAPAGTAVRAAAGGVVVLSHADAGGYGLHLVLDHGGGLTTLYGHLLSTAVRHGDLVGAGQVIGAVGSTGNSTGPHLHFEVRAAGQPVDPGSRLPAHYPSPGGIQ